MTEVIHVAIRTHGPNAVDWEQRVDLGRRAVLESVQRTSRLVIVEENPYQGGWGATPTSQRQPSRRKAS